jgi:hypothetical protein
VKGDAQSKCAVVCLTRPYQLRERLIQVLQNTLLEVEASSGVAPDDPALVALKNIILRRVANLQMAEAEDESSAEVTSAAAGVSPPDRVGSPVAAVPPPNEVALAELEIAPEELKPETTISVDSAGSAVPSSLPARADLEQKPS